ncbi:MAG: glycosyltransferase family 39 protein [Nocardioides sp.]
MTSETSSSQSYAAYAAREAAYPTDGPRTRRLFARRGPAPAEGRAARLPVPADRAALGLLLVATALLYLWGLGASGWANSFYAAAAQAGSESWKAFFFGSSDAANSITVDKTPLALWPMDLSVRIFGLSSWSILVPQALEGVGAVWLLHATVRRTTGSAVAALLAGATMALTPVAVLMFRFDNPDAMLVLLLVGSAYATLRAVEASHSDAPAGRWLTLAGALVGLAFLAKMLQAFLVLPALILVYAVFAGVRWRHRLLHLLAAFAGMVVAAGWWIAIVMAWPASSRPYIGGSQHNSILELTLGYNGFGRLDGSETGSVGGGGFGGSGQWGATGLLRMFGSEVGTQVAWLLPAALVLGAVALWFARGRRRLQAGLTLWLGWLVVTGLTFSLMAGIFHPYYTVALAPAIGALVGIGGWTLWRHRRSLLASATLGFTVALTTALAFELLGRDASWHPWLRYTVAVVGFGSAILVVAAGHLPRRIAGAVAVAALVAGLAGPAAYSLETASTPHTGSIPSAGPSGSSGFRRRVRRRPRWRWVRRHAADRRHGHRHGHRHRRRHGHRHGNRWHGCQHRRPPRREHVEHGADRAAAGRRVVVHLGRGHGRLEQRIRLPAGHAGPGDGDRRLQRQRPEPDAGAVQGLGGGREDPLLHRRRRQPRWRWHRRARVGRPAAPARRRRSAAGWSPPTPPRPWMASPSTTSRRDRERPVRVASAPCDSRSRSTTSSWAPGSPGSVRRSSWWRPARTTWS